MQRTEKQVIIYTAACHALVHIMELTYGVVLIGIGKEFGTSLFVLGIIANIAGFAFGLTALPAGFLADRIGERRLLAIYCLGSGLASIGVALSPNIVSLAVSLAILGLTLGIYHPVGSSFVTKGTVHRGIAFGYLGVGGNLGVALGPVLAGFIAAPLGWRAPYLIFAIPALSLAVLLYLFSRRELPNPEIITATAPTIQKSKHQSSIIALCLIFLGYALNGLIYRGLVTFLPSYLSQEVHISFLNVSSMALAGSFTTVALMFGVVGQFLSGYLCERRRHETLAVIVAIASTPLLFIMGNNQGLALMLSAILLAFFHFMGQPIYNSLIADYTPAKWQGRSYGISFFATFGIGSFSATLLGFIAEKMGTNWVFIAMGGISIITIGIVITLLVRALTSSNQHKAQNRNIAISE